MLKTGKVIVDVGYELQVQDNDLRFVTPSRSEYLRNILANKTDNIIPVGSDSPYTTIDAALAAITNPGPDNPYVLFLHPGTHEFNGDFNVPNLVITGDNATLTGEFDVSESTVFHKLILTPAPTASHLINATAEVRLYHCSSGVQQRGAIDGPAYIKDCELWGVRLNGGDVRGSWIHDLEVINTATVFGSHIESLTVQAPTYAYQSTILDTKIHNGYLYSDTQTDITDFTVGEVDMPYSALFQFQNSDSIDVTFPAPYSGLYKAQVTPYGNVFVWIENPTSSGLTIRAAAATNIYVALKVEP